MAESNLTLPVLQARRKPIVINANIGRVIIRPYIPPTGERICNIINRVLAMDEAVACALLEDIMHDFSHRHRYFREAVLRNFERVASHVPDIDSLSEQCRLLIGSYLRQISVEAAVFINPSMVQVSSHKIDPKGSCRFIMSFRATGEGHISSIEFRSGIVDENNDIYFDRAEQLRTHAENSYRYDL